MGRGRWAGQAYDYIPFKIRVVMKQDENWQIMVFPKMMRRNPYKKGKTVLSQINLDLVNNSTVSKDFSALLLLFSVEW